jgi:predicted helicase
LKSNRDAWVYNFSRLAVDTDMRRTIEFYNGQVAAYEAFCTANQITDHMEHLGEFLNPDPTQISWDYSNKRDLARGADSSFDPVNIRTSTYRPFTKEFVYFNRTWNNRVYQLPRMFPTSDHPNIGFYVVNPGAEKPFSALMTDQIPDLAFWGSNAGQFFSRYTYEPLEDDSALFDAAEGEVVDGYRRIDNITDKALARFHAAYGPGITKDDVFFYVYGLLHCPDYRTQFAADLKKMLPRIPMVTDPQPFIDAGRALSELHLGYESARPYPLDGLPDGAVDPSDEAAYQHFRIEKMRFGKPAAEQRRAGLRDDRSTIVYNDHFTLRGVPEEAYRYMLGSRSAIEWIMERYQMKVDKASGIRNDPNDWSREVGNPRYILDLLARIVTVSLGTMTIVDALPAMDIPAPEGIV